MLSVHTPLFLLGTRLGVELLGHRECVCSAFTDAAGQLSQLHSPQELTDRNTMQSGLAKKNAQVHATKPWDKGRCSRLRGGGGLGGGDPTRLSLWWHMAIHMKSARVSGKCSARTS